MSGWLPSQLAAQESEQNGSFPSRIDILQSEAPSPCLEHHLEDFALTENRKLCKSQKGATDVISGAQEKSSKAPQSLLVRTCPVLSSRVTF